MMRKRIMENKKRDVLIQGIGIALLVFVLAFFFLNAMFQSRFQAVYELGYEQGQDDCKLIIFNTSDQQDGVHYNEVNINLSWNFST